MENSVGLAFTTRNRPHVLEYSLKKTREAYDGFIVVVDDNSDTKEANQFICKKYDSAWLYNDVRRGIPLSKERGFRSLLTFDRQFWFDDDCYPLPGGLERFMEAMEYQGHLLYLKEWAHILKKTTLKHDLVSYYSATACLMTFRRDMYDAVKGFQVGFTKYGHWHNRLSQKLKSFGLDEFVSVKDASNYVYSFDLDHPPMDFDYHFCSSMSPEERKHELKTWHKYNKT